MYFEHVNVLKQMNVSAHGAVCN